MDIKTILFYSFIFIILIIFIISCGSHFNPKYYYKKDKIDYSDDNNNELPDFGGGDEDLSPEEDPFQTGEWNDPNYNGFTMDFDSKVIQAKFKGNTAPEFYKLVDGAWNMQDASKNEYYYDGPNTEAGGQSVSSVKYYLYKSKNPTFPPQSKYNQSKRLERFYFYRFTGKALGVVNTDNFLIAIDRYSKLVFAFAVPAEWKQYVPNTPYAPVKWQSVESGWESDMSSGSKSIFSVEGIQYFYEYDPVGILKQNGEIEIYQWCLDSIGNNKKYAPRFNGKVGDTNRAIATYGMPGRSPYMPLKIIDGEASQDDINKFKDDIKTLDNKDYKYRDYSGYSDTSPANKEQINLDEWRKKGYAGKSLMLNTYSFRNNGETLTIKKEHFTEGKKEENTYSISTVNSENKASYTNINDPNNKIYVTLMKNEEKGSIDSLLIDGIGVDVNFQDYGPTFTDRMKNVKFKRDGEHAIGGGIGGIASATFPLSATGQLKDLEYIFNEDGTEFTMKYQYDNKLIGENFVTVEYHFKLARFDSDADKHWTAKYQCIDLSGKLGNYTRVVLRDNDKLIRSSMTLHGLTGAILGVPDDPNSDAGLEMIANRVN